MLREAIREADQAGFPAVFAALPRSAWPGLREHLADIHVEEADAVVFGHLLPKDRDWWVDTAEI